MVLPHHQVGRVWTAPCMAPQLTRLALSVPHDNDTLCNTCWPSQDTRKRHAAKQSADTRLKTTKKSERGENCAHACGE